MLQMAVLPDGSLVIPMLGPNQIWAWRIGGSRKRINVNLRAERNIGFRFRT